MEEVVHKFMALFVEIVNIIFKNRNMKRKIGDIVYKNSIVF